MTNAINKTFTLLFWILSLCSMSVGANSIFESFVTQTSTGETVCSYSTESPGQMAGSGLTWGGHTHASVNTWEANVGVQGNLERLILYAVSNQHATKSANHHGTYAYTIFNMSGGTIPEATMHLDTIQAYIRAAAPNQQLRWLLRDGLGQWFLSDDITLVSATQTWYTIAPATINWLRVNTASETEMNQLDADAKVAIDEPATLSSQTPDLTQITGGGVYIEQGAVGAESDAFILNDLNWISAPEPVDLYIATEGSDSNPGTEALPFATLERARDEIRTQGAPPGDVIVYLRGGSYQRSSTFSLTSQDSGTAGYPVVYQAYPGEEVIFHGGQILDPASFVPVTDPSVLARLPQSTVGKIFVCDLPSQGVTEYGQLSKVTDAAVAEAELFFESRPMTLAQWPNEGFTTSGAVIQTGSLDPYQGAVFEYTDPRIEQWGGLEDVWVYGFWTVETLDSMKVVSIDPVADTIETAQPPITWGTVAIQNNRRMFFTNVLDELDTPTEYYIDRSAGKLYFYPPEDLAGKKVQLSVLSTDLISMQNVSHVQFKNLIFEASRAKAIGASDSSDNAFAGCTFRSLGQTAASIWLGERNEFIGCDVYETGFGGFRVFGGDRQTLTPGLHKMENSHFYNYSRRGRTINGWPSRVEMVGHTVRSSLAHGSWRGGFSFPGNDHLFEYNEVCNIIKTSNDTSAMGAGFDWAGSGTDIRYNFIHNYHGIPTHSIIAVGVYVDDGLSGNNVYQNVFYDLDMAFFSHGGRGTVVDNNLIINCDRSFNFMDPSLVTWWDSRFNTLIDRLEDVPSDQPLYTDTYPHLLMIHTDLAANAADPRNIEYQYPKDNVGTNNLIYNSGTPEIPANALAYGTFHDNYEMADGEDAGFIDPGTLNFSLESNSPVYTLIPGFEEIPFDQIGLYTDQYRTQFPSLGDFKLFLPENADGVDNGSSVDFVWQSCQFADEYQLEIATDSDFINIIRSIKKEDMCYSYAVVTVDDLPDNDTYYWRVKAITNARSMNLESKYNGGPSYFVLHIGDSDPVTMVEYATLSGHWLRANCDDSNDYCSGADRDKDGDVVLVDFLLFVENWLN